MVIRRRPLSHFITHDEPIKVHGIPGQDRFRELAPGVKLDEAELALTSNVF